MLTDLKLTPTEHEGWFLLVDDLHFTTTINQIHAIAPPYARDLAKKSGVEVNEPFTITVPKGFLTDLASIPKFLHGIFTPDGDYSAAAVVHDFLYQTNPKGIGSVEEHRNNKYIKLMREIKRFECDRIFYLAMLESEVSSTVAKTFFNAVRMGGKKFFRKETEAPDLNAHNLFNYSEPYIYLRSKALSSLPHDYYTLSDNKTRVSVKFPNSIRPFYIGLIGDYQNKEKELTA